MIRSFGRDQPRIHSTAYIHPSSELIGRVVIKKNASIWPMVVLRGDIERITIGVEANVQDATVMHTSKGLPVVLGTGVTIGHGAIVHGAKIGAYSLIGMGAILLDGCRIGSECLIGAGAVVPEHVKIPPRSLVLGVPGKVIRKLRPEELKMLHQRAKDYVKYADQHRLMTQIILAPSPALRRAREPHLILSSGSPQRKVLLRQLGIPFKIQPSHVDETCAQRLPERFVEELALRKAKATAGQLKSGRKPVFVLGADTVVVLTRKILGKPTDLKDAYRMLSHLSNSTHRVYTGVALVEAGGKRQWVTHAVSHVRMKKMPLDQILKYSRRHLDKAGAYAIQDRKDPYAQVVRGSYENVVGLPLEITADLLRKAGFAVAF